jgi:hypothetical protein
MKFLNKLFGSKKEAREATPKDFWDWFQAHEKAFYKALKKKYDRDRLDKDVLVPIMKQLHTINSQFYCQVGMENADTADLVITAEGDIKSFVFVDELIAAAPKIPHWTFTNLKPASGLTISVEMENYVFDKETISFYANNHAQYPDEIDLTLVHKDFNKDNDSTITNGCLIFLDTILGEYNALTLIDSVTVKGMDATNKDLIPIEKLNSFLIWREKEFVEKYKGFRLDDTEDEFANFEAETKDGLPFMAVMNRSLLDWDAKSSHPWMMTIEIEYDGKAHQGMPDETTYELMNQFDEALTQLLPCSEGYLNIGRETGDNSRIIYFACKEFKKASKTTAELIKKYKQLPITYEIDKDKYWRVLNRFMEV